MVALTRCYHFSASHRLHLDTLSEQQNEELYGKCNNPFGHGHNYCLQVSVAGPVDPQTGQLVSLTQLDALVHDQVLNSFDHRYINLDIPEFSSLVPTTENVLAIVGDRLTRHWRSYIPEPASLYRLQVQETERNGFETLFHAGTPVQGH